MASTSYSYSVGMRSDDKDDHEVEQPVSSNSQDGQNESALTTTWSNIVRKDFYDSSTYGNMIVKFRSPTAYRLQLRSHACDKWFPQDPDLGLEEGFGCAVRLAPGCPALAVAFDASSLVALGQLHGDIRMLRAGQEMYCHALKLMRISLKTLPHGQLDALAAAIQVVQATEAYSSMSLLEADWRSHAQGMTAILESRMSDDYSGGFLEMLDANFRTFYFWEKLISRRGIKVFFPKSAATIVQIAQRVPGILEKADSVCKRMERFTLERATAVLDELDNAEAQLNIWTECWNPSMRCSPFELVGSTSLPFPESGSKRPNGAFPLVFKFRRLSDAVDHAICSACLFSVKRATFDVKLALTSLSAHANSAMHVETSKLAKLVDKCADTLCMGLPYLCHSKHGMYGHITASGPLFVAYDWYKYRRRGPGGEKVSEKVLWCFEATKRLKADGIGPLENFARSHKLSLVSNERPRLTQSTKS